MHAKQQLRIGPYTKCYHYDYRPVMSHLALKYTKVMKDINGFTLKKKKTLRIGYG